ncbi:MAG: efflux RND transporter periplasmic adaptor subunit [Bacteroidales bacterium]
MKFNPSVPVFAILSLLFACGGQGDETTGSEPLPATGEADVVLTTSQFQSMHMEIGSPVLSLFQERVQANGTVEVTPASQARISTLVPGRVSAILVQSGEMVEKGAHLFRIEGNEIVELQQAYAESSQELKLLRLEYERLESLAREQVVAGKDFQRAESSMKQMAARVEGLKVKLQLVGLDPASVEAGNIVPGITVRTPVRGTVGTMSLVLGQFLEPAVSCMEVLDNRALRLNLKVFGQSLDRVARGQVVEYYLPERPEERYRAELTQVGGRVDEVSRAVACFAKIDAADMGKFIHNTYVEASIVTCEREALAVPEEAVIRETDKHYLLVLEGKADSLMHFRKALVRTGPTVNGATEILEEGLEGVLLKGVFDLQTGE